mmetsp:Transcript_20771/g.35447  ORF Transcript_20771/g.35447 Transcript_20771/m.35447 type:complete len:174 (+) Transcript_20771:47-568(+)
MFLLSIVLSILFFQYAFCDLECDAIIAATAASGLASKDPCFQISSTCDECIEKEDKCAYCDSFDIVVEGHVGDKDFKKTCTVKSDNDSPSKGWCWSGNLFIWKTSVQKINVNGNTVNIDVSCNKIPNFGQCDVSGNLAVIGGACLIVLLCCCCVAISVCVCKRQRRRSGYGKF